MARALANQTAARPGGLREAIIKLRVKMARESSKVKVISVHLFDMITPERTDFFPPPQSHFESSVHENCLLGFAEE